MWQADALRDLVRAEVMATLGDPRGVLVIDETGFLKKGTHSVGVARQCSGAAGRIENCQVGVFLGYASPLGQALIDRRLYLPEAWTDDAERRRRAQVPTGVTFATKPQVACELIGAALDAGTPCAWVLADALYGSDTRSSHVLRLLTRDGLLQTDPAEMADALPSAAWQAHAAGEGSKGPRLSDWARIALPWTVGEGFERWLLVRRNRRDADERACYFAFAPAGTGLAELAGAAGLRWTTGECFQRAKEELGLDHCEARSWRGWHRHMTLRMAALAFLAGLSAQLRRAAGGKPNERSPSALAA